MPEGHTIHRLARAQAPSMVGQAWHLSSPQGRFEEGAALLDGATVKRLDPYGKHLFYDLRDRPEHLHVHLGLFGKWRTGEEPAPAPVGALRLRTESGGVWWDLRGPTACEVLTPAEKTAVLARLGPDPLRTDSKPDAAVARIMRSRVSIGALLMDQKVLAGIGNVYRAELLFRHAVSPFRLGNQMREVDLVAMWEDLQVLMRSGVRTGRIITTEPADRRRKTGRPTREDGSYVYKRQGLPCRRCGTEILTQLMVGRNLFWCPYCQAD